MYEGQEEYRLRLESITSREENLLRLHRKETMGEGQLTETQGYLRASVQQLPERTRSSSLPVLYEGEVVIGL